MHLGRTHMQKPTDKRAGMLPLQTRNEDSDRRKNQNITIEKTSQNTMKEERPNNLTEKKQVRRKIKPLRLTTV